MPKVSVIIPVYNKENYLEATLASVLQQPLDDMEVIAVNDGSTDASLAILTRLAENDPRVRIVDIPNGGVSNARNVGLAHAAGEWIQFLDADDRLDAEYLQQAVSVAEAQGAEILFSGFTKVNEKQEPVEKVVLPEAGRMDQQQLCAAFVRYQYTNGFFGFISNKLFRRTLWETSGAMFPVGTTLAEDLDFYVRMYPYVSKAFFWQGNSFSYVQTAENYSNRETVDYSSQILIHMDVRSWFLRAGQYEKYRAVLDRKITEYAYFVLFHHEESGLTVPEAYRFLAERKELLACVDPAYVDGFAKRVLTALKKNNLAAIRRLLAGRQALRNMYRAVRKNG